MNILCPLFDHILFKIAR